MKNINRFPFWPKSARQGFINLGQWPRSRSRIYVGNSLPHPIKPVVKNISRKKTLQGV